MELIMNQTFVNETIGFDGFSFIGCEFRDCNIITAGAEFHFERCTFQRVKFLINPAVPIQAISHRLSQCVHEDTVCLWNDVYLDADALQTIRDNTIRALA